MNKFMKFFGTLIVSALVFFAVNSAMDAGDSKKGCCAKSSVKQASMNKECGSKTTLKKASMSKEECAKKCDHASKADCKDKSECSHANKADCCDSHKTDAKAGVKTSDEKESKLTKNETAPKK